MYIRAIKGRLYVYVCRWNGGRPRQTHLGNADSLTVEYVQAVRLDAMVVRLRVKELSALGKRLGELQKTVHQVVAAELEKRGYHREKSEWRRRRVVGRPTSSAVLNPDAIERSLEEVLDRQMVFAAFSASAKSKLRRKLAELTKELEDKAPTPARRLSARLASCLWLNRRLLKRELTLVRKYGCARPVFGVEFRKAVNRAERNLSRTLGDLLAHVELSHRACVSRAGPSGWTEPTTTSRATTPR